MEVLNELAYRSPKMALAQRNDPIKAFLFDRSHKSFGVRTRVRRLTRRLHDADTGVLQNLVDRPAPFRIPITDQDAKRVRVCHGQRHARLSHERLVWMRR
jgi:hypothetical protein